MENLIEDLINDQILNKGFNAVALAQFLANKGLIDLDEFHQFRDKYARAYISNLYPELFDTKQ